jgi:hypothetical protein
MKAISIRQPWPWLIVAGIKDIENRTWYEAPRAAADPRIAQARRRLDPRNRAAPRHRDRSGSPAIRRHHRRRRARRRRDVFGVPMVPRPARWVLREPRALPFMPARGLQRLFDMPAHPLLGELAVQRIDDRLF